MEILKTHKKKILSGILFCALLVAVLINYTLTNTSNNVYANEECICEEKLPSEFYVDIKGAVKKPGVYLVNENSIIKDIIDLAGGLKSNATTSNLNLAEKVTESMVITVNTKSELTTKKTTTPNSNNTSEVCTTKIISSCDTNNETSSTLVNINTASKEELMSVPNIGSSKADSIIIYRNEKKFTKIEDIMNVSGIGEALYVKIKDHITV